MTTTVVKETNSGKSFLTNGKAFLTNGKERSYPRQTMSEPRLSWNGILDAGDGMPVCQHVAWLRPARLRCRRTAREATPTVKEQWRLPNIKSGLGWDER